MPYNLGSTLDSVCGACACIYTSGASPMTLSPRDAANKKPYVFSLSGAQIVAQGSVSVNVGGEKTGSKKMNSINSLSSALGKTIQFDAYILGAFDRDDHLDLKICDGSCDDRQIVVHVPKYILTDDSICALSIGRGGAVRVKGGKVVSSTEIDCLPSTRISIM